MHAGSDKASERLIRYIDEKDWSGSGRLKLEEDGRIKLMAEAVIPTETVGALTLKIIDKKDEKVIGEDSLYFDFRQVQQLYEHWTVGTGHTHADQVAAAAALVPESLNYDIRSGLEQLEFENQYVLLVHGWRMPDFERRRFAETAMKRLYWEGYKGRFGLFSWPTHWFDRPPWNNSFGTTLRAALEGGESYQSSEAKARRSAPMLFDLLTQLKSRQNSLHIIAHSMGNVVVSEALKLAKDYPGLIVNSYIPMQSAEVAHAFDPTVEELVITVPDLELINARFSVAWPLIHAIDPELVIPIPFPPYALPIVTDTHFIPPPNQYQYIATSPGASEERVWNSSLSPEQSKHYYKGIALKAGRIIPFSGNPPGN